MSTFFSRVTTFFFLVFVLILGSSSFVRAEVLTPEEQQKIAATTPAAPTEKIPVDPNAEIKVPKTPENSAVAIPESPTAQPIEESAEEQVVPVDSLSINTAEENLANISTTRVVGIVVGLFLIVGLLSFFFRKMNRRTV
ncbi:MAG: hypothetical protein WCG84_02055 [Candidatus Moraniibacteriota bacterium]